IQDGAEGERPGPPPHPAALPGGEWPDRADAPDTARGVGRGGPDGPPGGGEGVCPSGAALQRAAATQRVGLPDAGRLLSRQSGGAPYGAAYKAGAGAAPAEGEEPGDSGADVTLYGGGNRCFNLTPVCATAVETIH